VGPRISGLSGQVASEQAALEKEALEKVEFLDFKAVKNLFHIKYFASKPKFKASQFQGLL